MRTGRRHQSPRSTERFFVPRYDVIIASRRDGRRDGLRREENEKVKERVMGGEWTVISYTSRVLLT